MKVSIIIVNWNGKHHLEKCLESLDTQTYQDFEVIFVDNNSNDGSVEYIKCKFTRVKIIALDDNYGFAKANNIGFENSIGEYIVFLNNDTEVDQDWLKYLVETADRDNKIGFVASKMVLFDNRMLLDNAGVSYNISGGVREFGRYQDKFLYEDEKQITVACAGSALYKRELLDKVGVFDENFFISYEDIDLSLKSIWAGYIGIYQPKSITYHKLKASRKSNYNMYTYYNQRNNSYVWFKNMPFTLKLKYFIPRTIYNFGSLLNSIKTKSFKYYIKSKIDFLKMKKSISKNNYRVISNKEFESYLEKDFFLEKLKKLVGDKE